MTGTRQGTPEFDAFIEGIFDQYNRLATETNREFIIGRGRHILRILRSYAPRDVDEEINVESFIEMFDDLIREAGGTV